MGIPWKLIEKEIFQRLKRDRYCGTGRVLVLCNDIITRF